MLLSSIQSAKKKIGLLELDQAPLLSSRLGLDISVNENVELLQTLLLKMGELASAHLTGLVIDPIYSFDASASSGKAGCLTRLNVLADEVDPLAVPAIIPDYGLEEMSNNYNLVKFDLFYHPTESNSLKKKQLLAEIHDYCDYLDMNMLLKLHLYQPKGEEYLSEQFQDDQLLAIGELSRLTELVALQYPLEPLAIATLTAELDVPWILMDEGQSYDQFKQELRVCLENGASGFLVSQALWQEMTQMRQEDKSLDLEQINHFLETTFLDRVIELMRIANEMGEGV